MTTSSNLATSADLYWAAASGFVRDVIEALGHPQPAPDSCVDLSAIALSVVGQIEELKAQNADLLAALKDILNDHYIGDAAEAVIMNDCQGHWIPATEEDGNDYDPVPLFFRNIAQRLRESRTAREDEQQPISRWEASRRVAEAR